MKMSKSLLLPTVLASLAAAAASARAGSLDAGFQNPPDAARPHTWWHWMNGNVTKEGITADLEAMKRVGIGGAQIFNVDCEIPAGSVKFMSPEWRELLKHSVREADRLGLEICLHNCAGWSSSGGPWNTPEHAMQCITTSEQQVKGPTHFSAALPVPPKKLGYYRDIAVLAFRTSGLKLWPGARTIQRADIVDLTSRIQPDGHLDWDAPAGDWTILRIGHTPTGKGNHPAPAEGTGPECDKLSKEAFDAHWAGFIEKVLADVGPLAGRGKALNNVLIDSYEVGEQNWTPHFRAEFQRLRGYDPLLYLPALTGRVVDSSEVTQRFQWDMRRTIADLFAENYYGHFKELCHKAGLQASIEPYTGPFESLQSGRAADIPMGEFWVGSAPDGSVKLAASVGHLYGRSVIGAESFTAAPSAKHGRWLDDAYALKALGDLVFCQGVNRFIFHRYAMQPWTDRLPGMTMGQWGTHFDRTSTWWEQGRAWLQYVARCQYLLQSGRFVADVAFFTGEGVESRADSSALPPGYDFDTINAGVLLRDASIKDGRLALPSGMSYRVLVLPSSDRTMTPAFLRKLAQFVSDGLILVGAPPQSSPSLQDYPKCDADVKELAAQVWGNCDGLLVTEHKLGQGKAIWGQSLPKVLASLDSPPDFEYPAAGGTRLAYIHRRDGDADIYFVSNQRGRFDTADCTFRVSGKLPELWDPETGRIAPAPVWREQNGRIVVPLSFDPAGSVFVVFRTPASGDHLVAVERSGPPVVEAQPKAAELRVLKAVYGPRESWADVTAEVRSLVAGGTRRIRAGNDLAGDDPAPLVVKRLRVEFILNQRQQSAQAMEGGTLDLPAGSEVSKAIYGVLPAAGARTQSADLTNKLARLIKDGELSVCANNNLAGGDPSPMIPKELRVEYSLDGARKEAKVPENDTLTLPDTGRIAGTPPAFTFTAGPDGNMRLLSLAPGNFTLRWTSGKTSEAQLASVPASLAIDGPWQVSFPPGWAAPAKVTFEKLQSWTEHSDKSVKYFSGTATYEKEIDIPADRLASDKELWLNLGVVKNFAEVSLNGRPLGILWKPPFRVNLTAAARSGRNVLQIKVTNLWPNRLIGDEQLPPDCEWQGKRLKGWPSWLLAGKPSPTGRLTFTTWHHWNKNDVLLDSGLLGPVTLDTAQEVVAP